jgi:hypothetical protein
MGSSAVRTVPGDRRSGRWWRVGARGAIPFSREEQFRLLQVGLRIKLRHESKPEDAIVLQRPDDLPAPLGTPVRIGRYRRKTSADQPHAGVR